MWGTKTLVTVGAVLVAGVVLAGQILFSSGDWWPNVLAEVAGLVAGGVVLALLLQTWLDRREAANLERRWAAVEPLVFRRLRVGLANIYEHASLATDFGPVADRYTPIGERLRRSRSRLDEGTNADPGGAVDAMQAAYLPLCEAARSMSDALIPLAADLAPDDALIEQLVRLERASCEDWWALHYYSARAGDADQWPEFREAMKPVLDTAIEIADRIGAGPLPGDDDEKAPDRVDGEGPH